MARVIVLGYLLVNFEKNWCQSRPHMRFIVTMALLVAIELCVVQLKSY